MQEKELRLALVCFGGVSLAIYIHGSSKEILKLVRASKAFHADPDVTAESRNHYLYPNKDLKDVPDTELVYFDILKALSPELDLRVIVDVIAGASAGGMNSIFLGRALAHDLSMDHLRRHWLQEADVSILVGNKKPAGAMNKIFSKPLVGYLSHKYLGKTALAKRVQEKLPALMNIWSLKPPFDGKYFLRLIFDGLEHMGKSGGHSLMPSGHRLDLFVTVTDYYGFRRAIPLYDPQIIHEREHRHNFRFSYFIPKGSTEIRSNFQPQDIPALSFAARATASYPGAFPPAQLRDVDSFMASKDKKWLGKEAFIRKNFPEYLRAGLDPMQTSFLDGSILNNKPFDQAIKSIQGRAAFREVDRRLVYIDPNPESLHVPPTGAPPSLLSTIKGAMSDIPMNEPMHDDLMNIQRYNQQVKTIRIAIDNIRPIIEKMVDQISQQDLGAVQDAEKIAYLRHVANVKSISGAGYAYSGYARLKVRNTVADLAKLIGEICDLTSGSDERRRLFTILHHMAFRDKMDFTAYSGMMDDNFQTNFLSWVKGLVKNDQAETALPSWGYFLTRFDVKYQRRRLLFVIKDLNGLYAYHPDDVDKLDRLKGQFYDILENIRRRARQNSIPDDIKKQLRTAFLTLSQTDIDDDSTESELDNILTGHLPDLDMALASLADFLNLHQFKQDADQLIADQYAQGWQENMTKNLAISYIGFSFWDVMTFSIMGSKEMGEFDEIKINRISPKDRSILKDKNDEMPLLGTAMGGFGAFFSRSDRENDYLWGRINSAERLIDLLYDQAKISGISEKLDVIALKKRAFQTILNVEKDHLNEIPLLFTELQEKIDQL